MKPSTINSSRALPLFDHATKFEIAENLWYATNSTRVEHGTGEARGAGGSSDVEAASIIQIFQCSVSLKRQDFATRKRHMRARLG